MAKTKKITQNINKDAGLLMMPKVKVPTSKWISKHTNYCSMNTGDIYPVYVSEVLPKEKRKVTMAMLSHMTTPQAPLLNAMYTELRAFFVPHRLSADLLGGYNTRKSPWVKVFGEDPSKENADIVVPIDSQKLPVIGLNAKYHFKNANFKPFGGISDALDLEPDSALSADELDEYVSSLNFLNLASYELIYQHCYRNQNRESATNSNLYKFLLNAYNRSSGTLTFDDSFHKANREKDYYTGAQPFTLKGDPVEINLGDAVPVITAVEGSAGVTPVAEAVITSIDSNEDAVVEAHGGSVDPVQFFADLSKSRPISIEELRLLIKTQEMLEKDMMYSNDYASYLNAHFGVNILKGFLDEPQEINKIIVTSQMQVVLQSSTTDNEPTILGTIGANSTTHSGNLEIVPEREFPEYGYLIICAVHKTQNVWDSKYYKPKHIFKKARFDYFAVELEDLGFQPVSGLEFDFDTNGKSAVGFNESYAEYRYTVNKVHGMLEPSRSNALDYWTTAISNVSDIESVYKQSASEVDRVISVTSEVAPQFFDAYGFIEINEKPMKLHSIPGFDGVI